MVKFTWTLLIRYLSWTIIPKAQLGNLLVLEREREKSSLDGATENQWNKLIGSHRGGNQDFRGSKTI